MFSLLPHHSRKLLLLGRGLLGFTVITSMFWSVQLLPLAGKFLGLWPACLLYLSSLSVSSK